MSSSLIAPSVSLSLSHSLISAGSHLLPHSPLTPASCSPPSRHRQLRHHTHFFSSPLFLSTPILGSNSAFANFSYTVSSPLIVSSYTHSSHSRPSFLSTPIHLTISCPARQLPVNFVISLTLPLCPPLSLSLFSVDYHPRPLLSFQPPCPARQLLVNYAISLSRTDTLSVRTQVSFKTATSLA